MKGAVYLGGFLPQKTVSKLPRNWPFLDLTTKDLGFVGLPLYLLPCKQELEV